MQGVSCGGSPGPPAQSPHGARGELVVSTSGRNSSSSGSSAEPPLPRTKIPARKSLHENPRTTILARDSLVVVIAVVVVVIVAIVVVVVVVAVVVAVVVVVVAGRRS